MKIRYFILLLFFTFCFSQNSAYACGEKKTCKKEVSKTSKKNCCDDACGSHKKENDKGCSGKCGHSSCVNPGVYTALNSSPAFSIHNVRMIFSAEKPSFYYKESQLSTGYYTIWLIPKIDRI